MAGFEHLKLRRGTEAEWTSANPILEEGEPAFSTDTGELRIGNGTDHWADLDPIAGGGGVTDHGDLTGLADDDHPQYTDDAEVIALAGPIADASATAAVGTHASDPDAHGDFLTEAEGDGLYDALGAAATAELNAVSTSESYTDDEIDTHEGLADPHPGYLTPAEGAAAYDATGAAAAAVATHAGLSDPHPGYLTPAEGNAAYDAIGAAAAGDAGHVGAGDPHTQYQTEAAHTKTLHDGLGLSHDSLSDVSIDDHHARDHAIDGGTHTGTLSDGQIPASITRDSEAAAAYAPIAEPIAAAHIIDTTDAHAATATTFTPDGDIAATTVQAAIVEVRDEAVTKYSKGIFGSGADGSANLDGTNTYPWCTLSGTTYTMVQSAFLTTLTVANGITLRPLGCILYVQGTLTNNGTISWNGAAAVTSTAGAAESTAGVFGDTIAGGAGRVNTAASGNAGIAQTTQSGLSPGAGGYGGAGTTVVIGGSAGSTAFPSGTVNGPKQWDLGFPGPPLLIGSVAGTFRTPQGGGGGGGGAGAASGTSGAGGAGGGIVALIAKTIINTGTISANGGAGSAASGTGPCGGGGGGGGGVVYMQYGTLTNSGTISANGGVGGAGVGTFVEGDAGTSSVGTASDTDGTLYTSTQTPALGNPYFIAVMNTVSAGTPEVPGIRIRGNVAVPAGQWKNDVITQLGTAVNGTQRITVWWTRAGNSALSEIIEAYFTATQTSCDIMFVPMAVTSAGLFGQAPGTANAPIVQVVTGTATAATTLVITLATEQTDSITFGFFAVAANVTMTAGANFTAGTALANSAPAGQMRHEAFAGQDVTVDMTTVANQNWVGVAIECQQGKRGSDGFPGRVVQVPTV
jgi:hypothetical protein